MKDIIKRIEFYLTYRAGERLKIGAIVFSVEEGILGMTSDTPELLEYIQKERR